MHGMVNVKFIVQVTFGEKKNALFCALYNTHYNSDLITHTKIKFTSNY